MDSISLCLVFRYTKYLYPYECHMKNLSSPNELQQAIDGNRREGRRSGYDSYPHMFPGPRPTMPLPPTSLSLPQISPLPPGMRPHSFNGTGFPGNISSKLSRSHFGCMNDNYLDGEKKTTKGEIENNLHKRDCQSLSEAVLSQVSDMKHSVEFPWRPW